MIKFLFEDRFSIVGLMGLLLCVEFARIGEWWLLAAVAIIGGMVEGLIKAYLNDKDFQ